MAKLSTYGDTGTAADGVAKQTRRLVTPRRVNVYNFLSQAAIDSAWARDGLVDCAPGIQAAIDYAYNSGNDFPASVPVEIYIPAGLYWCATTIYLDHPTQGIRGVGTSGDSGSAVSTDTKILQGDPGTGGSYFGTRLHFPNDTAGIVIGGGNGMSVQNVTVVGCSTGDHLHIYNNLPQGGYTHGPATLPSTGVGVVTVSGSGGNSRTHIERVAVLGFYKGFGIGHYGIDALGDSNRFFDCFASGCYFGWHIAQPQNYINDLFSCNTQNCRIGVWSNNGPGFRIYGGNYSVDSGVSGWFTAASTSGLTGYSDSGPMGGIRNATFTTTLSDAAVTGNYIRRSNLAGASRTLDPMGQFWDCDVNAWVVNTTNFGTIPLIMTNWDSTSHVATFKFYGPWVYGNFGGSDSSGWDTRTDVAAEIAAATTFYCAERVTSFYGAAKVHGVHVENGPPTTVWEGYNSVEGSATLSDCIFQYDTTGARNSDKTDSRLAWWFVQQQFPIFSQQMALQVTGCCFQADQPENILMDGLYNNQTYQAVFFNNVQLNSINLRGGANNLDNAADYAGALGGSNDASQGQSAVKGYGLFLDDTPNWNKLYDAALGPAPATSQQYWRKGGNGMSPYFGRRPAPWSMPRIKPSMVPAMVPAPVNLSQTPPLHGDTFYQISESNAYTNYALLKHCGHTSFTYGADIPVVWTHKGASWVVNISSGIEYMFPGLLLILDPTGGTNPDGQGNPTRVVVTGVYYLRKYITVWKVDYPRNNLNGTKNVVYGNTTIKQDRLNIKKYGRQCEFMSAAPTSSSVTWAVGDIVYNTSPATGGYVGWVCTVAGAPGTWKPFGLIA